MSEMAERNGRHGGVLAERRIERFSERRLLRIHPKFVVEALQQLEAVRKLPGELREDLVLLIGPRRSWIGSRLTVVVS
jgi:hypothetical protein